MAQHGLSKSRITSFEQCPKRLWLQVHRRELAQLDPGAEARFAIGHEVGDLACSILSGGIMIEAEPDLAAAIERTGILVSEYREEPLFEATFAHDGVLVRIDVLSPDGSNGWHVAEVKSSTSRKDYHLGDLATQIWVMREAGMKVTSAAIRHLDRDFRLLEEGKYDGLFLDAPSLEEIEPVIATRAEIVAKARDVLSGSEPEITPADQCDSPFPCEFKAYCNRNSVQPKWPIALLPYGGKKLAEKWVDKGITDLTQLSAGDLSNRNHKRIHAATVSGIADHDIAGARTATGNWGFPRCYLDFETIAFAAPRWLGTGPWQQVPFQFSLHVEHEDGRINHHEFLETSGSDPRRACAGALLTSVPAEGSIIAYNASFERTCIKGLAVALPDLADNLLRLADRVVDLLPVTRNNWYHRDQMGSWSIKAVLPTIQQGDAYGALAVQDGAAAQMAYLEAISSETSAKRRAEIERDLKEYCKLDTQAMIDLLHHLVGESCI